MTEKLKSFLADDAIFMALLLILVAVASFGLGRQSVSSVTSSTQPAGIVLHKNSLIPKDSAEKSTGIIDEGAVTVPDAQLVASKSGTKYHLLTCPGASQIKEANKITFNSIAAAEAAGYTAAANCKGI